jgi:hypothetical protein
LGKRSRGRPQEQDRFRSVVFHGMRYTYSHSFGGGRFL